ncbi:sulfite exporter TauE/SafE family protein [Desulforhopalus sp. IMCC35007]|uniref:sulfite exporter TauE/SafE family protein n=1 Tax=Desulforhopalus sp. IMCC35007 TaxID=2569543 RepID=UPI0010AED430|nr:sulfite exporter TauE/SafE family protein [Desulforhopalus sp. IMCC35007]TKB08021.1 sulfite exporter TauE/SafE family protein [Desulforhopalus sp. IMCC35007]
MSYGRDFYQMMVRGSEAYARWDLEASTNILRSRKRMTVLFLLLLPIILGGIALASGDGTLPNFLGGKTAYMPSHYTNLIFFASIFVGVCAGLITGCIGAGGGFIIAPALMSAGVKGILAVGTDLFHIFAKAIMGSVLHRKLGNISVSLAGTFLVGSIAGATLGGMLNRYLYDLNPVLSDLFITTVYVFILGFLSFYALMDYFKARKGEAGTEKSSGRAEAVPPMGKRLQSIHIPPMLTFDEGVTPGGRKISAIFLVISGLLVGLAASIMGVGGGFLTFPIFVYGLGVSSMTTVGTDIFQIVFTAGYSSLSQYAFYGFVFYTLAMGMLLGSLIGVQVGSLITKVVPGIMIRGFFALAVTAGFINRFFAMPAKLQGLGYIQITKSMGAMINTVGNVLFFLTIGAFAVWVFYVFFTHLNELRSEHPAPNYEKSDFNDSNLKEVRSEGN